MNIDKETLEQLARWHENNEFQKIVDTILAIPEESRDYNLSGQLARALNNLGDYETAAEILLGAEEEGINDPLWHYRLGYAYYYSNMFEQAQKEFNKVLNLTPGDEDAQMFLNWCEEELSPTAKTDKLNERLMATEALVAGITFQQRADAFWDWFAQQETTLARLVENREQTDPEELVKVISEGVRLIGEEVNFNVGGEYEFTFAVEGSTYLFYLLPWLVARMPEQFRDKWHFFPYMQGTDGKSFDLRMYDQSFSLDEVMVSLHYDDEQNYFDVRFYQEQLCLLPENHCYNAFYIMMELAAGEGLTRIYINEVTKAGQCEEGMFPLTKLESCISMALEEAQKEILTRPDERYTIYKMDLEENKDLRYDLLIGNTCYTELVKDYYNEETTHADKLDACGAKAVFLVVPVGDTDYSDLLKLRYDIEDRLANEVLGERGSGGEIGILLGGAVGRDNLYIDLLLYDIGEFIERAGDLLMQYPYPFYLSEFRTGSRLVAIAGVEAEIPTVPEKPGELARRMMSFMDCPCEWFAPLADAQPLDKAYFAALEAGRKEGYVPVLVKVDETLMENFVITIKEGADSLSELEAIRAYRNQMLGLKELPDVKLYLEKLRQAKERNSKEDSCFNEMKEGKPNNDLSSYWNFDTRLTDELLLVKVPVDQPWKVFAWLPMGGWNDCPDTEHLMAVAKYWYEVYGAIPAAMTGDELEFFVSKPVENEVVAMDLAREQYAFCPDCVDQSNGNDTVGKRADALRQSTIWYFWWD